MLTSLMCLSLAIYYEARDQSLEGQIAVAEVVLNRVESSKFPDTVCDVVWQRKQFSFTHDGKPENPKHRSWEPIQELAEDILNRPDDYLLGHGATHYHAVYVDPYWASKLEMVGKVGDHIFYKE